MKKIIKITILSLLLVSLTAPFTAKGSDALPKGALAPHPDHYVTDYADLLDREEEKKLDAQLKELSEKLNFDIVVVTTHDLEGKSPMDYCVDFSDYSGYGLDKDFSGICFLRYITEDGSDYEVWISTTGKGLDIFSDSDIQYQIDLIADDIIAGRYYNAFRDFGNNVYDDVYRYTHFTYNPFWLVVAVGLGLIVAASSVAGMKRDLLSVAPAGGAAEYIKRGSFKLLNSNDTFLYSNVKAVPIPRESSSGGGSHSSHHSSSGRSHGGGGRHI
jgi:uncharacterized protein